MVEPEGLVTMLILSEVDLVHFWVWAFEKKAAKRKIAVSDEIFKVLAGIDSVFH